MQHTAASFPAAVAGTYVYGGAVTTGGCAKFSTGGGDVVCHSRPVAPHGFAEARGP